MDKLLTILLIIGFLSACKTPEEQNQKKGVDAQIINATAKVRIDSTLQALVNNGSIAGVSALIYEHGKEVYFNAFGNADADAGLKMDRNTIVRIFSMTKPVTGVALMQLYEKGMFQLDDPITKYAPEFKDVKVFAGVDAKGQMKFEAPRRPITIRDLTRHTAGFARPEHPQLGKLVTDADVMNKENTLREMAKKLSALPLAFHPGEQWSYGVSVDVQAYLVEIISGKPFDEYVKENILQRLGMNETGYVPVDMKRFAAMYQKDDGGKLNKIPDTEANAFNEKEWPLKPGGYGLTSTLDDYMKFARMLLNKGRLDTVKILEEETVKLMATNHLSDSVAERMWLPSKGQVGFGINFAVRLKPPVDKDENNGAVGEFFWDGAASTLFWVDPRHELCAVLFVQVLPFDRNLHKQFRDAVYGPVSRSQVH